MSRKIHTVRDWKKIEEGIQFTITHQDECKNDVWAKRLNDGYEFRSYVTIYPIGDSEFVNFFISEFRDDNIHVTCYTMRSYSPPSDVRTFTCEINDIIIHNGKFAGIKK